ncbi:MAG: hypothetical protein AAGC79_07625, partial [Pseudomonadota bacterium]
ADPGPLDLPPPEGLDARGLKAWIEFQGSEFGRAFATGPKGQFGWGSGYPSGAAAAEVALEVCAGEENHACTIYMIDEARQ